MIQSYRDLEVWQRAMEMVAAAYRLTAQFPTTERFGLVTQIQRSAVSVPSNIAEGHARQSTRDYLRFLAIALGSLAELETQVLLSEQLQLASNGEATDILALADRVGAMLRRLQQALRKTVSSSSRAPNPELRAPIQ